MKNKPLSFQIWVVIVCLTTSIFILVCTLLPLFLNQYLSREMYASIESEQELTLRRGASNLQQEADSIQREVEQQDKRTVKTFLLRDAASPANPLRNVPEPLLAKAKEQVLSQSADSARYSLELSDERLFYVIRKLPLRNRNVFMVSYMWDTYYHDLMKGMIRQLVKLTGIVMLLSFFPAVWLSRYLSRPLVRLGGFVKSMASRQWQEPLHMDRKDEIGQLAASIEIMRDQLKRQDDYQQSMLQHVSHELKTPVMVIRSYTQSIQDGIYPKGDLEGSLQVIEQESERLDKRIRDLLYLTKLDYMANGQIVRKELRLDLLLESVAERLKWQKPGLEYRMSLAPVTINGDPEQWTVAVENLLDNQIRYARSLVGIHLTAANPGGPAGEAVHKLVFGNDGPPLPDGMEEQLFSTFRKGPEGQFGLGLAIVRRITDLHHAKVRAVNTPNGVEFRIFLPAEA